MQTLIAQGNLTVHLNFFTCIFIQFIDKLSILFEFVAPTLEARSQKARSYRKNPGASGRLHRTEAGDWVWSSDSEGPDGSDEESDDEGPAPGAIPSVEKGIQIQQFVHLYFQNNHRNQSQFTDYFKTIFKSKNLLKSNQIQL